MKLHFLLVIIFFLVYLSIFSGEVVFGASNGNVDNNKYGIHLAQPSDEEILKAGELINSNGGSWGYITLVIHEDDRNVEKWQGVFDKLREKKLIPIIRLATKPKGENWERPEKIDAKDWVSFLNSLRWVVKNRYIILFNEPNHATEWGGEVDAKNFAGVVHEFAKSLKDANNNYFIMMGGLDLSAPSMLPRYEDAAIFLSQVVNEIGYEDFNLLFDGLSSHSYPNPAFSSSPTQTGRRSVRGYEWELSFLQSLNIKKLPVFITETGWDGSAISRFKVADYFLYAYNNIWLPDKRVYAVTPFILSYQAEPFLKFSWLKQHTQEPQPEFLAVKDLPKIDGKPEIEESGEILFKFPQAIVEDSTYYFQVEFKNFGQGIWSKENNYDIAVADGINKHFDYIAGSLSRIKPAESRSIDFYFKTKTPGNINNFDIRLLRNGNSVVTSKKINFEIVPRPELLFKVSLFPIKNAKDEVFEIQIFDEKEHMVTRATNLRVVEGVGLVDQVENIALDKKYRVVILNTGYLPRQVYVTFKKENNLAHFEPMLPFDPSGDGALTFADVFAIFK
jgi:hypothetical protein